jgi:hypothetical protein
MVIVFALSVVDRGLEPRSVQTKDYKVCIKHAALRRKGKYWLALVYSGPHLTGINLFSS